MGCGSRHAEDGQECPSYKQSHPNSTAERLQRLAGGKRSGTSGYAAIPQKCIPKGCQLDERQDAGFGIRDAGCGIGGFNCPRQPVVALRLPPANGWHPSGMREGRCGMRGAGFGLRDSGCKPRSTATQVLIEPSLAQPPRPSILALSPFSAGEDRGDNWL